MADTTVGQAIALGNLARPDTTKVFTNAVMRGQEMNLRRRKMEQDEAAKKQQLQAQMSKMIDTSGKFIPMYQKEAKDVLTKYNTDIMMAVQNNDVLTANRLAAERDFNLDNLSKESDIMATNIENLRKKGLIPPDLFGSLNKPKDQAIPEIKKMYEKHPEYKMLVSIDEPNNRVVVNDYQGADYNKEKSNIVRNLRASAQARTPKSMGNDFWQIEYEVPDELVRDEAITNSNRRDVIQAVRFEQPQKYLASFNKIKEIKEKQLGRPVDENNPEEQTELIRASVEDVLYNDFKTESQVKPMIKSRQQFKDFGFDFPSPTKGGGGLSTTTIKRRVLDTYEDGDPSKPIYKFVEDEVRGGSRFSFKPVEVLSGKGESYLNLETNERMTGGAIQLSKVGDIKPYPVATEDIVQEIDGKKRVVVKRGELVTKNYEGIAKKQGAMQYVPRWEAITRVKNILGTKDVSTLIDFEEGYGAVIAGQSKDDVALTNKQIKSAQEEANKLNSRLPKVTSQPKAKVGAAPKGVPKGKKAGESFDAWKKRTKQTSYSEFLKS
jgi:hypothetical protein